VRRGLRYVSAAFILAGLELSTSAVGFALARLRAGASAILAGVETGTGTLRYFAGVGALSLGLGMAIVVYWSARLERVVARGGLCPACGARTDRVKRRPWHRWLSLLMGQRLTRRRCVACGWTGLAAAGRPRPAARETKEDRGGRAP
jgi:hypothetical protein